MSYLLICNIRLQSQQIVDLDHLKHRVDGVEDIQFSEMKAPKAAWTLSKV